MIGSFLDWGPLRGLGRSKENRPRFLVPQGNEDLIQFPRINLKSLPINWDNGVLSSGAGNFVAPSLPKARKRGGMGQAIVGLGEGVPEVGGQNHPCLSSALSSPA